MAAMDVARSLSLQPPSATQDMHLRENSATSEPHYRLSRLHNNQPPPSSTRPPSAPSIISRSVSAGMTFSFNKKEKDKDRGEKDKDYNKNSLSPFPDERSSSRFGFGLRKKVSLASLISSTAAAATTPDDGPSSSRTSSMSSSFSPIPIVVPPLGDSSSGSTHSGGSDHDSDDPLDEIVPAPERFVRDDAWRTRRRMKLHPYSDVPYMQAYDPVVLDKCVFFLLGTVLSLLTCSFLVYSEKYTYYLMRRLAPSGSPTFHLYQNSPPASVLDLGCGTGLWLLDAARVWRGTQFVGLDLVDVVVPQLTDGTLPNIRLVRGDFLNYALPFPDRQFELVRMANLSLCIPHTKWEYVLREVARVLAPGGRLELIDDQAVFPYGDAPVDEATTEIADEEDPDAGALSPTPTAHPDVLSPSTPTPRAPATADASGFFDSDSDEEEEEASDADASFESLPARSSSDSSDESVSDHSISSFTDAASTLVGSERGSVELKKISLLGPPQLEYEPAHVARPFSGIEHLVISIPPPSRELPAVVNVIVDSESENEVPPTPVPVRALPPIPIPATSPRPSLPTPTSASSKTTFPPLPLSASSPRSPSSLMTPPASASSVSTFPAAAIEPPASSGPWSTQRNVAQDLERVFTRMIACQYKLHTKPSDIILPLLTKVFCSSPAGIPAAVGKLGGLTGRVERPASMHLKLAPLGAEEREGVTVRGQLIREEVREREGMGMGGMATIRESGRDKEGKNVKAWMSGVEQEREKEVRRKKSKMELPKETPLPQGVSAKAAGRLGIAVGGGSPLPPPTIRRSPPKVDDLFDSDEESVEEEEDEDFMESPSDEEPPINLNGSTGQLPQLGRGASTWTAPDEWAAPPTPLSRANSNDGPTLSHMASSRTITAASSSKTITAGSSSKTIKQLGIELPPAPVMKMKHSRGGSTASAMSAASRVSSTSTSSGAFSESGPSGPAKWSSGRVQHPGLVLWPSTFIPLGAHELEMHATKHVQTLLGCKPALAEYISSFKEPGTGKRVVSEEEFEETLWEYECFRRERFRWPEMPEGRLDLEPIPSDFPTPASARSVPGAPPALPPMPRTPTSETPPRTPREDPHPFGEYELTHVRSFRVYNAIKGEAWTDLRSSVAV
ncbi:Methyltransf-25 domain-containing protein [Favolaschia claudopus]|uniref:Methyltransf-25 domain-containing protein n=1 Tax=Favolaschia claudopus TaxID=2862362 RepID=A0AAW0EDP7_9AGAR